jgi:hypothetical protein
MSDVNWGYWKQLPRNNPREWEFTPYDWSAYPGTFHLVLAKARYGEICSASEISNRSVISVEYADSWGEEPILSISKENADLVAAALKENFYWEWCRDEDTCQAKSEFEREDFFEASKNIWESCQCGDFYFADESAGFHGPYATEEEAREAFKVYAENI